MARYSSDTKVLGAVALSILGTSRLSDLEHYFNKYGIYNYDENAYYPVEPLIAMMNDIVSDHQGLDSTFDLVSLGIANGRTIALPPEVNTLEKWLDIWSARHPMLYHGTDIGYIITEKLSETNFVVHIRWPWADDVAYGTIYGMCLRFLPSTAEFAVYYDENLSRADFGAEETVIHIEWH
ncbi:MAG TPA: hypothetical protein PKD09_08710 [Aggregatilinea sp.]|jgi:hypothetical protein|uniref:hypothetical protein n=1 Tax=Aggregatilinea sp. TaxID=2806333 RepID=UPI002C61DCD3|nr:hypothetical protein [Aggregatilinea sp.]HML21714.1 hypothetical protein [Aggregatilinea sp.]